MLPSLRIMTLALDTVDESEMLSVDALSLVLKREAARRARDLPLSEGSEAPVGGASEGSGEGPVGVVGGDPGSDESSGEVPEVDELAAAAAAAAAVAAALTLLAFARAFLRELSLPSSPSLDSSNVDAALKESARRKRPLRPPERTILALGTGTGSPSCESSLLMLKRLLVMLERGVTSWRGVGGDAGRIVPDDVGRAVGRDWSAVENVAWPRGLGFTGRRTS